MQAGVRTTAWPEITRRVFDWGRTVVSAVL
jgi:hypothetical protein